MKTVRRFAHRADPDIAPDRLRRGTALASLLSLILLAGCGQQDAAVTGAAAPPAVQAVAFNQAVENAANAVLSSAPASGQAGGPRQLVVIDPLVDGITGEQTAATQAISTRIVALARAKYPQFDIQPFSPQTVSRAPYVMVGTFTPVNAQGQTAGDREGYRFCLVMADLRSGKTVAKGVARARMEGVDATPTRFFRESPAWTEDAQIKSYINTCQATKVGDPLSPVYVDGLVAASIISEATDAYNAGRYRDAADLYARARGAPAGNQLRVYNGLYLANWKLGRQAQAATAFGEAVDHGLTNNRLGVKFLFRPGSTALEAGGAASPPYTMWLQQIAGQSARKGACLQVTGNASKSGMAAINERLSLLRAEHVKDRLATYAPTLTGRVIANGAGSQANLIGTGTDNLTDALDRRVEFKVLPAC